MSGACEARHSPAAMSTSTRCLISHTVLYSAFMSSGMSRSWKSRRRDYATPLEKVAEGRGEGGPPGSKERPFWRAQAHLHTWLFCRGQAVCMRRHPEALLHAAAKRPLQYQVHLIRQGQAGAISALATFAPAHLHAAAGRHQFVLHASIPQPQPGEVVQQVLVHHCEKGQCAGGTPRLRNRCPRRDKDTLLAQWQHCEAAMPKAPMARMSKRAQPLKHPARDSIGKSKQASTAHKLGSAVETSRLRFYFACSPLKKSAMCTGPTRRTPLPRPSLATHP